LHTLWKETNIGKILPWDDIEEEEEKLIAKEREEKQALSSDKTSQQRDDELVLSKLFVQRAIKHFAHRWVRLAGCIRWCGLSCPSLPLPNRTKLSHSGHLGGPRNHLGPSRRAPKSSRAISEGTASI
jgi:hypothetical protein